jgi:hypothetical protein
MSVTGPDRAIPSGITPTGGAEGGQPIAPTERATTTQVQDSMVNLPVRLGSSTPRAQVRENAENRIPIAKKYGATVQEATSSLVSELDAKHAQLQKTMANLPPLSVSIDRKSVV